MVLYYHMSDLVMHFLCIWPEEQKVAQGPGQVPLILNGRAPGTLQWWRQVDILLAWMATRFPPTPAWTWKMWNSEIHMAWSCKNCTAIVSCSAFVLSFSCGRTRGWAFTIECKSKLLEKWFTVQTVIMPEMYSAVIPNSQGPTGLFSLKAWRRQSGCWAIFIVTLLCSAPPSGWFH